MSHILKTPEPPYYVVLFTAEMNDDLTGYAETNTALAAEAAKIPGFIGVESAGEGDHISAVFWESLEAIDRWRNHSDHIKAKQRGRDQWYQRYKLRICRVETDTSFES